MKMLSRKILIGAFLCAGLSFLAASSATAQGSEGNLGLGGQLGEPAGITLKTHNPGGMSYDFLAAFDLDDFFYLNVHGIFEKPFSDTEGLNFFYGPGAFIGIYNHAPGVDNELALGISGRAGLNYYVEQFEIYAQITPRIEVLPATNGDIGGGLGFRYYF